MIPIKGVREALLVISSPAEHVLKRIPILGKPLCDRIWGKEEVFYYESTTSL